MAMEEDYSFTRALVPLRNCAPYICKNFSQRAFDINIYVLSTLLQARMLRTIHGRCLLLGRTKIRKMLAVGWTFYLKGARCSCWRFIW